MNTILVGFEQTDSGMRALSRAADVAERFGARLVVLSVAEAEAVRLPGAPLEPVEMVPTAVGPAPLAPPMRVERVTEQGRILEPEELARRPLEGARAYLAKRSITADYVVGVGDPASRILDAAEEHHADLIVVGHREHGFLERLLSRPVDDAVARRAHCDVLLVG